MNSDHMRAALWMSGAIASFSAMAVAGRAVSLELDTFEIMLYRSLVGILVVLGVGGLTGALQTVTRRHLSLHVFRNLAHFAGQNLWFFALTLIPLAQVFALEFTSPIWVLLLSPLLLGERLTGMRLFAGALGFAGVLLIAQPAGGALGAGTAAAALCAIAFALSIIFTKKLTRSETITCILFYLTVMQAVFGLICAGFDGDIATPSAATLPWLVLIGCAGLLAHFCLTTALSLAPASFVVPIDFIRLPLIAVIGMLFYGEPLSLLVLAGGALVFLGNYLNILASSRT